MSKKESYISVQSQIIKKLDLIKKLNIKTLSERGKLNKAISELRQDKKVSTKTNSIEQLKDAEKYIASHFEEFKKFYDNVKSKK